MIDFISIYNHLKSKHSAIISAEENEIYKIRTEKIKPLVVICDKQLRTALAPYTSKYIKAENWETDKVFYALVKQFDEKIKGGDILSVIFKDMNPNFGDKGYDLLPGELTCDKEKYLFWLSNKDGDIFEVGFESEKDHKKRVKENWDIFHAICAEEELDLLEKQFIAHSGCAFREACLKTLASGLPVTVSENGWVVEISPDGSRRKIKELEPPTRAKIGEKIRI
jgi:hypothetical protein